MKKIFLLLMAIFIVPLSIYSQEAIGQKTTVLSPNAESFKVYGDIPVSLYTGIPQIKIPLYDIQTEYVHLDISLSYHAAGFKADVRPSWVGLGWNLNAGGVISRNMKYLPDENNSLAGETACPSPSFGIGFYHSYSVLDKSDWHVKVNPNIVNPDFNAANYVIDREPDIFSFNFLGYSGKFYLNHLGRWMVQCDIPLKVEFDPSDINSDVLHSAPHFTKFTLVDDKGVRYVFGGDNAIEYTASMLPCQFNYAEAWLAQSWHLKEIIPPVGEKITYTYERGPYQSGFSCIMPDQIISGTTAHDAVLTNVAATIVSPVYLTSIDIPSKDLTLSFITSKSNDLTYFNKTYTNLFYYESGGMVPSGFLNFHPTSGIPYFGRNPGDKYAAENPGYRIYNTRFIWLKLDEIRAAYANSPDGQIRKTVFQYNETGTTRLKLNKASIQYVGSEDKEDYSFEYNHSLPYMLQGEPEYLSEYGDSWGFSNMKYLWKVGDKDNSPKQLLAERAKLGVLSKITYPTKGCTMFFFENNDYGAYVTNSGFSSSITPVSDIKTAGLRVSKIISVDGKGGYTMKGYSYKDKNDELSSGVLHAIPAYFTDYGYIFDNSGAHVTYSAVTEKNEDGTFKYTDFVTEKQIQRLGENVGGCMDDSPAYVETWVGASSFCERDFERGKVLNEYYCNADGKIYQSTHYSYSNIGKNAANYVRTVDTQYLPVYYFSPGYLGHTGQSSYYYYCYKNKVSRIRNITYGQSSNVDYKSISMPPAGSFVVTDKTFEYDSFGQVVKETEQASSGESYSVTIEYPYTHNQAIEPYKEMITRNMLSYPIRRDYYRGTTYLNGIKYNYSQTGTFIRPASLERILSDNSTVVTNRYKYNAFGYLYENTEYTGKVESYIWDCRGRRLMAVTENATADEILSVATDNNIYNVSQSRDSVWWSSQLATIRTRLSKVHLRSYGYKHGDLMSLEIRPSGESVYYVYDRNERVQSVLDHSRKAVRSFAYNYQEGAVSPGFYFNENLVVTAYKNCPGDYISEGSVQIGVSAGEEFSTISQADANAKARAKYQPIAQEQADNTLSCVFSKSIEPENSQYSSIISSYIRYYNTDILLGYMMFDIETSQISISSGMWYTGVPIGKITSTPKPVRVTYREISDGRLNKLNTAENLWIIWIGTDGTIWIRLKDETNGRLPDSTYLSLTASGDLDFPIN